MDKSRSSDWIDHPERSFHCHEALKACWKYLIPNFSRPHRNERGGVPDEGVILEDEVPPEEMPRDSFPQEDYAPLPMDDPTHPMTAPESPERWRNTSFPWNMTSTWALPDGLLSHSGNSSSSKEG